MAHFGPSLVGALLEGVTLVRKPMLVGIPFSVSFHISLHVQLCGVVNIRSFQHSCVNPEKKTYDGRGLGTWEGSPQCDLW